MKKNKIWILIFLSLFFSFFLAYQIQEKEILKIDQFFLEHVVLSGRNEIFTTIFKIITNGASVLGFLLLFVFLFLFIHNRKERMYLGIHFIGVVVLSQILKFLFQRSRPLMIYRLVTEHGYSFPSGHSMVGGAVYGYLIYLLGNSKLSKRKKILFQTVLSFFIVGIGFSRIYLGVHYASDVLAGFSLGIGYTLFFILYREGEFSLKKNLLHSFYYAGVGIFSAFLSERNMKIHVFMMTLVIFFGIYFHISYQEWMICIVLFGMVISTEIVNTAIETVVDLAMPEIHPKAKLAKDLAAGAVLVVAIVSAIVGLMIFLPKIL